MDHEEKQAKSHPPTGEAIPQAGLRNKFLIYVERATGKSSVFIFLLQRTIFAFMGWMPTILGSVLRAMVYRLIFGKIDKGCLIEKNVRFAIPSRIFLGNRVFIGEYCYIDPKSIRARIVLGNDVYISRLSRINSGGSKDYIGEVVIEDSVHAGQNCYLDGTGKLLICKDVILGPNVTILTANHEFKNADIPIRLQGAIPNKTVIETDVWIGANVTILDGITIGRGSVVGAGSVVTNNLPPFSIAVGIPARVIGKRGNVDECFSHTKNNS